MGMKRRTLILAGLSAIMLSACQVFFVDDSDTSIVQFSASAGDARTKTEYGGDDGSGWELIKWLDTDQVTIHMSYTDEQNASIFDAPKDYGIKPNPDKDGGHISYGGLVPHSDPLRWHGHFVDGKPQEYAHQFYSAYPAGKGGFSKSDHSFTFSLPDKQNGTMDCAYMAAVKEFQQPREKNEDKVQLDYYPLVTAVSVTLTNATGETIENLSKEITLSSGNKALAGAFTAVLSTDRDRYIPGTITGTGNAVTVSATANGLEDTEGITVHMFLLPQDYGTSDLTLKVGDTSFPLAVASTKIQTLGSCKKYNISINLKLQNGEITPDPPKLSKGGAQMMLAALSSNKDNVKKWLKEYFNLTGDDWNLQGSEEDKKAYEDFLRLFYTNEATKDFLGDDFFRAKFAEADTFLNNLSEEELEILKFVLSKISSFAAQDDLRAITSDIEASDFDWLPGLESIGRLQAKGDNVSIHLKDVDDLSKLTLQYFNTVTIEDCDGLTRIDQSTFQNMKPGNITIKGCKNLMSCDMGDMGNSGAQRNITLEDLPSLTDFSVTGASSVSFTNCESLKKIRIDNAGNLTEIKLIDTPYFTEGTTQNVNQPVAVTLKNCSTKVTSATLNLNGKGIVDRTNSDNVKVQ